MKPDRKKQKNSARPDAQRSGAARVDEAEPSVAHAGMPVWVFVLLALMLFWSMVYLDNHAGGFRDVVYGQFTSTNAIADVQPYDPKAARIAEGMKVYNMPTCVSCHQPTGMGIPGQFPPLVHSSWVMEPNPARMVRIILDGLTGPLQVEGATYNNTMVAWRPTLNDDQIAAVATYVRGSWGNNAPAVTAEEVAKIRKETDGRSTQWTADELMKVPVAPQ